MISISVITDQLTELKELLKENNLEREVFLNHFSNISEAKLQQSDDYELSHQVINVKNNEITVEPDWSMQIPPILFPSSIPFTKSNFLAIVYLFLGDEETALTLSQSNKELEYVVLSFSSLKHQWPLTIDIQEVEEYHQKHNIALLAHYGLLSDWQDMNSIKKLYVEATEQTKGTGRKLFTKYYFSLFLIDAGLINDATEVLAQILKQHLNTRQTLVVKYQYVDALLLSENREEHLLILKAHIKELIALSRTLLDEHQEAMVMQLAADVAEMEDNYIEALGCLQKSLNYFNNNQLELLAGNAQYKKGELLLAWARKGNPSMYVKASDCYREALKLFTKESAPETFARVHHKLGMIYADMPFQPEKRAMIAALSVTSFNEALNFFSKENHPYEYAAIQQDLGNAYLKYPESLHTDNYKKAIQHYQEALLVRTKEAFPLERSITLLNYLETLWLLPQEDRLSESLMDEMEAMAKEVVALNQDRGLVKEADRHLTDLEKLKIEMSNA